MTPLEQELADLWCVSPSPQVLLYLTVEEAVAFKDHMTQNEL